MNELSFREGSYRNGSVLKFRGVVRDVLDPEFVRLEGPAPSLVERVRLRVTLFPHSSDWAKRAYCATSELAPPTQTQRHTTHGPEHDQATRRQPQAVNVYVYDGQYGETRLDAFKVNEAFEFVGIWDSVGAESDGNDDSVGDGIRPNELEDLHPVDAVPRSDIVVHCCNVRSLDNLHHVRPHESREFYVQILENNGSRTKFCHEEWTIRGQKGNVMGMRHQLVQYLTEALCGDTLAAEYVLLSLLSHVYSRADASTPLGNLSLNLALDKSLTVAQQANVVARVEQAILSLMPMVARVDLSLTQLNSTNFMPHKDYERGMLVSGVLQVANGTTILADETALTAGELNEQGVKNIAALQSLMEKMLLPYDFKYFTMDFPQDVAVVTLSGGKSVLPATVVVPVIVTTDPTAEMQVPEDSMLDCFRVYLSVMRSFAVTIGNQEAEMAEKHYLDCRKSQRRVALEDLHRWLRLARLVALSRGDGRITKNSWDAMLTLETERFARLLTQDSE
ncbi:hypothetical protein PsorP6_006534 [Peronosclerospora sorghi]|uniref:Uncharacterized protein n=1 Tax=Peronosclerospora sorghi TaxID=230839 RepID=A0ACC0W112_9STRA|nr:hypothetical protein PsorP6_006534 [Peronosclerospora sorghi]